MPTVPNYVRVGDRIVSCPPGSEWRPANRSGPGSTNGPGFREVPIPRAHRVQNWEPNPRLRSSSGRSDGHDSPSQEPSQEQTDNLTRRQIGQVRAEVEKLRARIAAFQLVVPEQEEEESGGFHDNYGLGPEHAFGQRIYRCLVGGEGAGAKGIAYRNSPSFDDKDMGGHGPKKPQCIMADRICQGTDAIFIRDIRNKKWLPLLAPGGDATFQLLGMASGPHAINLDAMNIHFNDGANKLDDTPDSPGWRSPAPSFNP